MLTPVRERGQFWGKSRYNRKCPAGVQSLLRKTLLALNREAKVRPQGTTPPARPRGTALPAEPWPGSQAQASRQHPLQDTQAYPSQPLLSQAGRPCQPGARPGLHGSLLVCWARHARTRVPSQAAIPPMAWGTAWQHRHSCTLCQTGSS